MNCCCSVTVKLVHYSVFTLPYSVTQSTDQGPHWDWACDSIKAQRKFLQRMRTKSHAGKGKGKEEGGVEKYGVTKFHSKDDWLLYLRLISCLYFYYTWCEVVYWCKRGVFVENSCLNWTFGSPPPIITDLSCFECVVSSNSEWWISPFHMASSYGLVQGSKGESVYSPVMSAHDITWVHSSAGSLGRYLGEITQAKRRLAGSPFIRLQDELFHTNLSLGAFF